MIASSRMLGIRAADDAGLGAHDPPARGAAWQRPAVLIVDDTPENLLAFEAMLRREDLDIVSAGSGREALELLLDRPVALAILDVQMPEMDGFELASVMRGVERTRNVPIIFVTAGSKEERRVFEGYDAGAVDFLFKPVDPHVLASKVDVFVALERQRQALRRSEARFRSLVQASSQAVWLLAPDGTVLEDSPSWRAPTDTNADDWLGERASDAIHPHDRERVDAARRAAMRSGQAYEIEYRMRKPGGCYTWTAERMAPVRDDANRLIEWVGANTDIQPRKEAEILRETFVGILGHDLRNPLSAILSITHVLLHHAQDEAARQHLQRLVASAQRMARMIEQLLDLTRVRLGGGIALSPAPADLRTLVEPVLGEFAADRTRFHVEASGDTGGTWDVDRLQQIVSNLAGNAVAHAAPGTPVTVRLDCTADEAVEMLVHNSGEVIPEAVRAVIFEPFRRSAETPQRASRGLGLGLFITRQLVIAHGGRIGLESSDQAGTTFRVWLPRHVGRSG